MKIQDIMNKLFEWSPLKNRENGSDFPIFGDMEKDVAKVGVCIIATPDVLRKAKELGVEFIINHEGTYHTCVTYFGDEENYNSDKVVSAKKKLV